MVASKAMSSAKTSESGKMEPRGMDNAAVIQMVKAGLETDVVLSAIDTAPRCEFDTSAQGLIQLAQANVDRKVIRRIQEVAGGQEGSRQAIRRQEEGYPGPLGERRSDEEKRVLFSDCRSGPVGRPYSPDPDPGGQGAVLRSHGWECHQCHARAISHAEEDGFIRPQAPTLPGPAGQPRTAQVSLPTTTEREANLLGSAIGLSCKGRRECRGRRWPTAASSTQGSVSGFTSGATSRAISP